MSDATVLVRSGGGAGWSDRHVCDYRLSNDISPTPLYSARLFGNIRVVPLGAGTNYIALRDGDGRWQLRKRHSSGTIPIDGLAAGDLIDVYAYWDGATVSLRTVKWTNDTTRGSVTPHLVDGVRVAIDNPAHRWLGTVKINSVGFGEVHSGDGFDTANGGVGERSRQYIWNAQNLVPVELAFYPNAGNYTYGSSDWRDFDGSPDNLIEVVNGSTDNIVLPLGLNVAITTNPSETVTAQFRVGLDGANYHKINVAITGATSAHWLATTGALSIPPGYHTISIRESNPSVSPVIVRASVLNGTSLVALSPWHY